VDKPQVVAIFNTSPDIVELLRIVLEEAGFVVITAFTHEIHSSKVDVESIVRQHQPSVIVYDIAPPYEKNYRLFEHTAGMPAMQNIYFMVTTTNEKHLRSVTGPERQVYEIAGKPYDLGVIVEAVKRLTGRA
jgi:DNA-binding NtrC family response regulator